MVSFKSFLIFLVIFLISVESYPDDSTTRGYTTIDTPSPSFDPEESTTIDTSSASSDSEESTTIDTSSPSSGPTTTDTTSEECWFDYNDEIWETGELVYHVNKLSKGPMISIKTKYVTKVSIESDKYIKMLFQDSFIVFILTEEYKTLYDENFEKYSVKMKFKCSNSKYKYLSYVLINDDYLISSTLSEDPTTIGTTSSSENPTTIGTTSSTSENPTSSSTSSTSDPEMKYPPKFIPSYFEFNLSMPIEANTIINGTTITVEDFDKDKKNVIFEVLGEYSELFEFLPATNLLNRIYLTKLKTRKHVDLKHDISFNIMATNTAVIPLSTASNVNIKVEKQEHSSTKTYQIEVESKVEKKSVYTVRISH